MGTAGASARPAKARSLPGSTQGHGRLLWELPLTSFSPSRGEICMDQGRQRAGRGSRERMGSVITESHPERWHGTSSSVPFTPGLLRVLTPIREPKVSPAAAPGRLSLLSLSLALAAQLSHHWEPQGGTGRNPRPGRDGRRATELTTTSFQNNQRPLCKPALDSQLQDAGSVSPRCVMTVGSSPSDTHTVSEMEEERGQGEHRRTGALGHEGPVSEVSRETRKRDGPMKTEPQQAVRCEIRGPTGRNRMDADAALQDASRELQPGLQWGSARTLGAELGRSSHSSSLPSPA